MFKLTPEYKYLSEEVLSSLQAKGLHSVYDFLKADNKFIERNSSLTFLEIGELKKLFAKTFSSPPLNGLQLYQKTLIHSAIISTGFQELDKLLHGGFYTGTIYEFCGHPDSNGNLFISAIVANVISSNSDKIFILDTKREFSGKLLNQLVKRNNQKDESVILLNRILIKDISSKFDLISALFAIRKDLEQSLPARLIIINSLPSFFLNFKDRTENNYMINQFANILRYIAHEHHIVIIVTNLLTTWVDGDFIRNSSTVHEKIACGKYWRNIPNIRIKFQKTDENRFKIILLKSNKVHINPQETFLTVLHT